MRYRDPIPTFRAIYRFARRNMTAGGKACLFGMLCSLIGLVYLETPLLFLFCALFALLIAGAAASILLRPHLQISVIAPPTVLAGDTAELEVYLRNARSRPAYDLTISMVDLPDHCHLPNRLLPFVPEVPRKRVTRVGLAFQPEKRGVFSWPRVRITSAFPFNLFRFRQSQRIDGELVVLPKHHPLHNFDLSRIIRAMLGSHAESTHRVGASDQYFGNREYQPGITVRRWDYCSWARLGLPVIREYHHTQHQAVEIFTDTFPAAGADDERKFEAVVSLTMSLTHEVLRDNGMISSLSLGPQKVSCTSDSIVEQADSVAIQLALATPATPHALSAMLQNEHELITDAAVILAVFNGWDAERQKLHRWLLTSGCAVKPIIVTTANAGKLHDLPHAATCVSVESIEAGTVELD
ncbi:MAG TPA: hypothetical protein DCY79_11255 [Planctomycetaceae bacterium]|nr:hypothetical protein [Blastopirellula sp.]HAY80374.1 hypothetical protein [Planctomycetaceae bacterium]